MIGADVGTVKHGAAEGVEIAAHELNAAFIRDSAVLVGAIQIGAAVLGDFQRRWFYIRERCGKPDRGSCRARFPRRNR